MTPDDAQHIGAHAMDLGLSASVESADASGSIVRVWLNVDAALTLAADTSAVRYLLAHLTEIAE